MAYAAKKQFAVIGLGRFGSSIANALSDMGFDVLAIDSAFPPLRRHPSADH